MLEILYNWLLTQNVNMDQAVTMARWLAISGALVFSALAYVLMRYLIIPGVGFYILRTDTHLDDVFIRPSITNRLAHLAPALVVYFLAPGVLNGFATPIAVVQNVALLFIIVIALMVINAVLDGLLDIYHKLDSAREIPLKNFIQVIKIVVYLVGGLFILAILLDRTPLYLLSGLGALTAIVMLVFRDPILGLTAGVQLTANQMVARGDWIEMPKYDAEGTVLEVALTTVKVRNADQSITTIPTYALISESFKNWRGMQEVGARRIKRAIFIDLTTIRFCDAALLARLRRIPSVQAYLEAQEAAAARADGEAPEIDLPLRYTNVGFFRTYVKAYLEQHPHLHKDKTLLVRQRDPMQYGLPMEIYAYSTIVDFGEFEDMQAEIFDHILAIAPEFELRIFQNPAGTDVRAVVNGAVEPHLI